MKLRFPLGAVLVPFFAAVLLSSLSGCRGKSAPRPIDAAIVPNADFILRCDVQAAGETPVGKKAQQIRKENEKQDPSAQAKAERQAKIEKATGLTRDDIELVLMTAALGTIDLKSASGSSLAGRVPGALAITLSKPLTLDQLRAAATIIGEDGSGSTVGDVDLDGTPAIMLKPASAKEPPAYAAISTDGKTVYITLDETALRQVLARHRQNKPEPLSPAMVAAEKQCPADAQLRAIFIVPDSVRQAVKDRTAEAQKGGGGPAGMLMGVMKPFENIRRVSLLARLATEAIFTLSAELGTPEDAAQVAMIVPLLQSFVPPNPSTGMPDLAKALSVTNSGAVVSINLKLTEQDLSVRRPLPVEL